MTTLFAIQSGTPETQRASLSSLEQQIQTRLQERLRTSPSYTVEEIAEVSSLSTALFPPNFTLDAATSNNLRALARLSQVELRPARDIASHRKFIGPLIVLAKRLTWPLIQAHLKQPFQGLQEFCSRMVSAHAALVVESRKTKVSDTFTVFRK